MYIHWQMICTYSIKTYSVSPNPCPGWANEAQNSASPTRPRLTVSYTSLWNVKVLVQARCVRWLFWGTHFRESNGIWNYVGLEFSLYMKAAQAMTLMVAIDTWEVQLKPWILKTVTKCKNPSSPVVENNMFCGRLCYTGDCYGSGWSGTSWGKWLETVLYIIYEPFLRLLEKLRFFSPHS